EPPVVSGVHDGPALIEVPRYVGRESLAVDRKPPLRGVEVIRVCVRALKFEAARQPFLQVYLEAVVPGPRTGLDRIILPEIAVGPSARDLRSGTRRGDDGANMSRREEDVRRRAGYGRTPHPLGVRPVGDPVDNSRRDAWIDVPLTPEMQAARTHIGHRQTNTARQLPIYSKVPLHQIRLADFILGDTDRR